MPVGGNEACTLWKRNQAWANPEEENAMERHTAGCSLDFFWEQADLDSNGDNPLEVELCHRLDALARYQQRLADAEAAGQDELMDALMAAHDREQNVVRRLHQAIGRMRARLPV